MSNSPFGEANKLAQRKKQLRLQFIIYCWMVLALMMLNFFTSPGVWWWTWASAGWGIAIVAQYLDLYAWKKHGPATEDEDYLELREMEKNTGKGSWKEEDMV
jgi:2TM domain